jgi:hypothetical protein
LQGICVREATTLEALSPFTDRSGRFITVKDHLVNFPLPAPPPPTELLVVGELRADPMYLLLLGVDGRYFAYALLEGDLTPVEPSDEWQIEHRPTQDRLRPS